MEGSLVSIYIFLFGIVSATTTEFPDAGDTDNKNRSTCPSGFYGYRSNCKSRCQTSCARCDDEGICLECSQRGLQLPDCSKQCDRTYFGQDCRHKCDPACLNDECDPETGFCVACRDKGYSLPSCTFPCLAGTYGTNCEGRCPLPCQDDCDRLSGVCLSCDIGQGPHCTVNCALSQHQETCTSRCPARCVGWCNTTHKRCSMCTPGFKTPHCREHCDQGTYGSQCKLECSSRCKGKRCDPITGECKGCVDGYVGARCNGKCIVGLHGAGCLQPCPEACADRLCTPETGACEKCQTGYVGPLCDKLCEPGRHGDNCSSHCPPHCRWPCDPVTGECHECVAGYEGPRCNATCTPGLYGLNCNQTCPLGCLEELCHPVTGECSECKKFFYGAKCSMLRPNRVRPFEVVVYSVLSLLTPIVLLGVVMACYKQRSTTENKAIMQSVMQAGRDSSYARASHKRRRARGRISKNDIHILTDHAHSNPLVLTTATRFQRVTEATGQQHHKTIEDYSSKANLPSKFSAVVQEMTCECASKTGGGSKGPNHAASVASRCRPDMNARDHASGQIFLTRPSASHSGAHDVVAGLPSSCHGGLWQGIELSHSQSDAVPHSKPSRNNTSSSLGQDAANKTMVSDTISLDVSGASTSSDTIPGALSSPSTANQSSRCIGVRRQAEWWGAQERRGATPSGTHHAAAAEDKTVEKSTRYVRGTGHAVSFPLRPRVSDLEMELASHTDHVTRTGQPSQSGIGKGQVSSQVVAESARKPSECSEKFIEATAGQFVGATTDEFRATTGKFVGANADKSVGATADTFGTDPAKAKRQTTSERCDTALPNSGRPTACVSSNSIQCVKVFGDDRRQEEPLAPISPIHRTKPSLSHPQYAKPLPQTTLSHPQQQTHLYQTTGSSTAGPVMPRWSQRCQSSGSLLSPEKKAPYSHHTRHASRSDLVVHAPQEQKTPPGTPPPPPPPLGDPPTPSSPHGTRHGQIASSPPKRHSQTRNQIASLGGKTLPTQPSTSPPKRAPSHHHKKSSAIIKTKMNSRMFNFPHAVSNEERKPETSRSSSTRTSPDEGQGQQLEQVCAKAAGQEKEEEEEEEEDNGPVTSARGRKSSASDFALHACTSCSRRSNTEEEEEESRATLSTTGKSSSRRQNTSTSPGLVRCATTRRQVSGEARADQRLAPLPTPPRQGRAILRPVRKLSRHHSKSNSSSSTCNSVSHSQSE